MSVSRLFDVILALALVAGLAIFLDPSLREKAASSWEEVKPMVVEWRGKVEVQFREWFAEGSSWIEIHTRNANRLHERTGHEPVIEINLDALKESLLKIWTEIRLRIRQWTA